jgi:DNA repair protein RadA/Sms
MTGAGLEAVGNPSAFFLDPARSARPTPGSAHVACVEGTRPLLIEIQALVAPSPYGTPQRVAGGFDSRRLALLLAVLEKRAGFALGARDVFLNVVGGLTLSEPAVDLGVIIALASSHADRPVRSGTVVFGEVGLTGELRPVRMTAARLGEAERLGFSRAVIAAQRTDPRAADAHGFAAAHGLALLEAESVAEAVTLAMDGRA